MAEENQVTKEPQSEPAQVQQITKEPQQIMKEPQGEAEQVQRVTTKNPKKVEAGKRLAESNGKKREAKKQAKLEVSGSKPILWHWSRSSYASYRWSWLLHLSVQARKAMK